MEDVCIVSLCVHVCACVCAKDEGLGVCVPHFPESTGSW